ncbi:hypothetical protein BV22DRAFT_1134576 [Leucogyrophana mollusca]|uniref:Uncharacterized protein n=1 Tax=Leucogyrophana mollusca TaxID=85980 RepID=A0ACB8AZR3_9AGAM|nr:hypothetical protein BV22DRAFT_1134576 [Leucogyrophana mollusca]
MSNFGIAATQWENGDFIRVYHQQDDLGIYELAWDIVNKRWIKGNGGSPIFIAKRDTPLAVIFSGPLNIWIYYIDLGNRLREYVFNGSGWSQGQLQGKSIDHERSTLTAVTWGSGQGLNIRVYHRAHSGYMTEHVFYDGGWVGENSLQI